MLFYSMFKTLVGKEIAVELKNDVALTGTLHSIDQYLNIKLLDARVVDAARHPQLVAVSSVFVRGSVVRYVQLPAADVDAELLQDACRKAMGGVIWSASSEPVATCHCHSTLVEEGTPHTALAPAAGAQRAGSPAPCGGCGGRGRHRPRRGSPR